MVAKPQSGEERSFLEVHDPATLDIVSGMCHPNPRLLDAETQDYVLTYKAQFEKYRQVYHQLDEYLDPFLENCLDEMHKAIDDDNLPSWCRKHMVEFITVLLQGYIQLLFRERRLNNNDFSSASTEVQMAKVKELPSIQRFVSYNGAETTSKISTKAMFDMIAGEQAPQLKMFVDALHAKIPFDKFTALVERALLPKGAKGGFITYNRKSGERAKGERSNGESSNGESSNAAAAIDADMPQEEIHKYLQILQKSVQEGEPKEDIEASLNLFNQPLQDEIRAGLKLGVFSYGPVTYQLTLKKVLKATVMHFWALYWREFSEQDGQKRLETLRHFQEDIHMGPETIGWQPLWKNLLEMQLEASFPRFQIDESPKFGSFVELVQWIAETTEILVETVVQLPDEDVTFEQVRDAFLRALHMVGYPTMQAYPCKDVVDALQYDSEYTIECNKYDNLRSEMKAKAAAIQKGKEARPAFSLSDRELDNVWLDLVNDPTMHELMVLGAHNNPAQPLKGVQPLQTRPGDPAAAQYSVAPMEVEMHGNAMNLQL
jgi:hypothetical protein